MATIEHCTYCFDTILNKFDPGIKPVTISDHKEEYPLFVTFKILPPNPQHSDEYDLRGCIGTFSPMKLGAGLREYALISAFRDSRFEPISHEEVPRLRCDVSLLMDFEETADVNDWQVGVHGITIKFQEKKKSFSATYLPEVASEQGWTRKRTLQSLVQKAGYRGHIDSSIWDSMSLTRYKSSKCSLTYNDYAKERQ